MIREAWRIVVFAHNEERLISRALRSLIDEVANVADVRIFVLCNGCTDRTLEIVNAHALQHNVIVPISMTLGDKCNAWNEYVYQLADDSPVHFFIDGDVRCAPGSLGRMATLLQESADAYAVAGVPCSGRNRQKYEESIRKWRLLFGNLYGVKASRLRQVRERGIRLPLGMGWDDHAITTIMRREFDDIHDDGRRIVYDRDSGYLFDGIRPWIWRDLCLYWRRRVTYRLSAKQIAAMYDVPAANWPETTDEINHALLVELNRRFCIHPLDWGLRHRLRRMYPGADTDFHAARYEKYLVATEQPRRNQPLGGADS